MLEEPIHFFDLARWYLASAGNPVELYALGNSRDPSRPGLYDNFSATFRYANGAYAVVSQTLAAFEHHQTVKISTLLNACAFNGVANTLHRRERGIENNAAHRLGRLIGKTAHRARHIATAFFNLDLHVKLATL